MERLEALSEIDEKIFESFQEFFSLYPEISKTYPFRKTLLVCLIMSKTLKNKYIRSR